MEDGRADVARRLRELLVRLELEPGMYSCGSYCASAGCDAIVRVSRSESAATLRSSGVDR